MTAPTAADYALVDKHGGTHKEVGGPFSFLWRAECAAALAELRADMQAKLDAERKLADALLAFVKAVDDTDASHCSDAEFVAGARVRAKALLAAHAAARKEG